MLPNLAFLLVLYVLTRGLLRFARLFCDAVAVGRVAFKQACASRDGAGPSPEVDSSGDVRNRRLEMRIVSTVGLVLAAATAAAQGSWAATRP